MRIRVKLMAHLRTRLPPGSIGGVAEMDVPQASNIATLLVQLGLGEGQVHLVMVNGAQETDRARTLADGDEVAVFPPVAGG